MWPFRTRWCSRSLKPAPKDAVPGFQRRILCTGCHRAITVSQNGRLTRHVRVRKSGPDHLAPEGKLG